jgi:hypothetical protein
MWQAGMPRQCGPTLTFDARLEPETIQKSSGDSYQSKSEAESYVVPCGARANCKDPTRRLATTSLQTWASCSDVLGTGSRVLTFDLSSSPSIALHQRQVRPLGDRTETDEA